MLTEFKEMELFENLELKGTLSFDILCLKSRPNSHYFTAFDDYVAEVGLIK